MTILVTGASGLVGSAFVRAAHRRGHRVIGLVGSYPGEIDSLERKLSVDLSNESATTSAVLDVFPEAIVNCAALSAPEACEANPALAQALNVGLPAALARLAHHVSARLVHISSEQVFDGTQDRPYRRDDPPNPINLYARQKLEGERAVHAAAPEFAATIRAPLLLGNSLSGRRSTHERLLLDWSQGKTARLYTDEFRQPCTAENLAEVLLELAERKDALGLYHWAGAELVSRYALGVRIREHFKLSEQQAPIASVSRADTPEVARKRQPRLALDLTPLAGALKTRPQTIADQLEELRVPEACRAWYFAQA